MKSEDSVGVTFVNSVIGRGVLNGIVNLTFLTFNFSPTETAIEPDPVVSCRLRMDIMCAKQLHAFLGELLTSIEKKESANGAGHADPEHAETTETLN